MREFDKPWVRAFQIFQVVSICIGWFFLSLDVAFDMPVPPINFHIDIGVPSEFSVCLSCSASCLYIEQVGGLVYCFEMIFCRRSRNRLEM